MQQLRAHLFHRFAKGQSGNRAVFAVDARREHTEDGADDGRFHISKRHRSAHSRFEKYHSQPDEAEPHQARQDCAEKLLLRFFFHRHGSALKVEYAGRGVDLKAQQVGLVEHFGNNFRPLADINLREYLCGVASQAAVRECLLIFFNRLLAFGLLCC